MRKLAQNPHSYFFLAVLLVLTSCVKEMDFDGVKDITLEPEMEAKLAHAEITTEEIITRLEEVAENNNVPKPYPSIIYEAELPTISSDADVDITSEERVIKYLDSASLNFKIVNTTPRTMDIRVELLRSDDTVIDSLEETIPAYSGVLEPAPDPFVFDGETEIEELKKLTKVKIEITMHAGIDLRTDPSGKFEMTTTGFFKFNYDISNGLP